MKAFIYFVFVACIIPVASCNYISQRAAKQNQILDSFEIVNNKLKQENERFLAGDFKKIGTQIWTTTNLNTATFRNGDLIPEAESDSDWYKASNNGTPAWCYYDRSPANGIKYGKLYNWYALNDSRGLAPKGWHVPGKDEWRTLINYLGGDTLCGSKLKTPTGWIHNGNGDNSSGFSELPGGMRCTGGAFDGLGGIGEFWSSTEGTDVDGNGKGEAWITLAGYIDPDGYDVAEYFWKGGGFSVRCVKD